jgi:hypothetical protein
VLTCPQGGEENSERAKFCLGCSTPLRSNRRACKRSSYDGDRTLLRRDRLDRAHEKFDPEALRAVLVRYFERMKAIVVALR